MPAEVVSTRVFEERHVTVTVGDVRYLDAGAGTPLAVLHGGGGLRTMRAHELLAEYHRVVLVEMPGFGESTADTSATTAREYADSVHEAITAIVGSRYSLLGTSFGSRVASWITVQHENEVDALVLLGATVITPRGFSLPDTPGLLSLYAHPERYEPPEIDPTVARRQLQLVKRLLPERDPDLETAMASLSVPTIVAFGTADSVMPPTLGRKYLELNPEFFLSFFYDAGHTIEMERPEALANLVRSFVEHKREYVVTRDSSLLFP